MLKATNHILPEMMFGFGEEFAYFECSKCGCLQISEIPVDISKYYPSDYYSFSQNSTSNYFAFDCDEITNY